MSEFDTDVCFKAAVKAVKEGGEVIFIYFVLDVLTMNVVDGAGSDEV